MAARGDRLADAPERGQCRPRTAANLRWATATLPTLVSILGAGLVQPAAAWGWVHPLPLKAVHRNASADARRHSSGNALQSTRAWAWNQVGANGLQPDGREGHSAVAIGDVIYIFGGCKLEIKCFNDVHVFDTSTSRWSLEPFTGHAPAPRGGHSATLVGSEIFVFGGANSEETFGDSFRLDPVHRRWSRISTSGPGGGAGPGERTGHAAASDARGQIYVFGGYTAEGKFLNDLWVLGLSAAGDAKWQGQDAVFATWSIADSSGPFPVARESHSLTYVDGKLLVFGGYTSGGVTANDVHAYHLDEQRWHRLHIGGAIPGPRQAHSAVRHGHSLIVAGGCDVSAAQPLCYSDVWSLDLEAMRWTQRTADAASWGAREGHTANFVRGKMFAFGGCELSSWCFGDVSALDTLDPCPWECGRHGTCAGGGQFCSCTSPGFGGHDCMEPNVCLADCGVHGACSQNGRCVCEQGWTGESCDIVQPCPGSPVACGGRGLCLADGQCRCDTGYAGFACDEVMARTNCKEDCSGHGICGANAKCKCSPGWAGEACNTSVSLLEKAPIIAGSLAMHRSNAREALDPFKQARHHQLSSTESDHPENKYFGVIEVNKAGKTGADTSCEDQCNFRGLCSEGVCYCQPGFYGETCHFEKKSGKGTHSLWMVLVISGTCLVAGFTTMMCVLSLQASHEKHHEKKIGYNV